VVTFNPADYGVASYGLTYITTEQALSERAEDLTGFLRAVLRGIEYAGQHPDEAIGITLEFAPGEDPAAQRFILDSEMAHAQSDITATNGVGWQTTEQWDSTYTLLRENGGLTVDVDTAKAWTDALLKQVYRDGKLTAPGE
jgi:ABC-type nitrate/sulfonate/bicarbonate transport system substrate-binding protein